MPVKNTEIVRSLPTNTVANTEYLVPLPNGKYEAYQTDNANKIKKLNIDIPENLLRRSAVFNTLINSGGSGSYITARLWNSIPVVYGLWKTGEWGVSTRSISLLNSAGGMTTKELANKKVTISVDVCIYPFDPTLQESTGIEIGLGYSPTDPRPFTIRKSDGWVRIYGEFQSDRIPGIQAKFKVNPSTFNGHLTSAIAHRNWKISETPGDIFYVPCWNDGGDSEVYYSSTLYVPKGHTVTDFNTEALIGNQLQDGKTIGLIGTRANITITGYRQIHRTTYLFLKDDTQVTFFGGGTFYSNSDNSNPRVFTGNRGDSIYVQHVPNDINQNVIFAEIKRFHNNTDYVVPVTSSISLNSSHVGKVLQFNNTSNINVTITGLPPGATVSGVKNTGGGSVTFIGTTAPSSGNVLTSKTNSSFSLIKNPSGTSNLLINNL